MSSTDPQPQPLLDLPAPAYVAPGLQQRSKWVWIVAAAWLLLAGWTTHLTLSIVAGHAEMSERTAWWERARAYHEWIESTALDADEPAGREWFLEHIPGAVLKELRDPELFRTVPLENAMQRESVYEWGRVTPALSGAIETLETDDDADPSIIGEPAGWVAHHLGFVLNDVMSDVTTRAQALRREQKWLIAAAVLSILAAGAGVLLASRVRRSRDLLLVSSNALRESEERYRNMFEKNKAIQIVIHPGTRRIVDANQAACDFYGGERDLITSKRLSDFVVRAPAGKTRGPQHNEDGVPVLFQHRLLSGDVRDVEVRAGPITGFGKRLTYLIIHDVTERREAERALAEQTERLDATLRSMSDGVITTDVEGTVLLLNQAARQMTGWKDETALGRPLTSVYKVVDELSREDQSERLVRLLRGEPDLPIPSAMTLTQRLGGERIVQESNAQIHGPDGADIGYVIVLRDVTERRALENEILRAQRLDSLGVLAGGIAHDFNNFLAGMMGNVSLARLVVKDNDDAQERLKKAEAACALARNLTQQLLTFSKGGVPVRKTGSVNDLVHESIQFAMRGSNVKQDIVIAEDLDTAFIDRGQINQVLHNLVLNADQAMLDGGTLTVRAENVTISEGSQVSAKPGRYLRISVNDTGVGIPPENLDKIFDPYFTTKKTGSGLGLASCYSIVRNHDGMLTVESEVDVGTTFYVYLPASREAVVEEEPAPLAPLRTGGRVLIMDDDPVILDATSTMLRAMGYEAVVARHGQEALALYDNAMIQHQPYDLVVLDLTVPGGMGGLEAMGYLVRTDPEVRVVVSSGYANDEVLANYRTHGFCGVLPKPYTRDELTALLSELIGNGSGNGKS